MIMTSEDFEVLVVIFISPVNQAHVFSGSEPDDKTWAAESSVLCARDFAPYGMACAHHAIFGVPIILPFLMSN